MQCSGGRRNGGTYSIWGPRSEARALRRAPTACCVLLLPLQVKSHSVVFCEISSYLLDLQEKQNLTSVLNRSTTFSEWLLYKEICNCAEYFPRDDPPAPAPYSPFKERLEPRIAPSNLLLPPGHPWFVAVYVQCRGISNARISRSR